MKKIDKKVIIAFVILVIISIFAWLIFDKDIFHIKPLTDLQKIENFSTIRTKVVEYYQKSQKLPSTLDELTNLPAKYEYKIQSETNFKLCTTFDEDVTQEIITKASIRVDYKKGSNCITFNIADSILGTQNSKIIKSEVKLVKLPNTIAINPIEGVSAGSINIKFDSAKSLLFRNDTDGNYLLNLYTTISTEKECEVTLNPEKGCCYSLNEISLGSEIGIFAQYNKLGSSNYIIPFPQGAQDTFGDLPINFCFQDSKGFSGGINFSIPKELINLQTSSKLQFKNINNGETSQVLEITIN
jgi:hypothetical protein